MHLHLLDKTRAVFKTSTAFEFNCELDVSCSVDETGSPSFICVRRLIKSWLSSFACVKEMFGWGAPVGDIKAAGQREL